MWGDPIAASIVAVVGSQGDLGRQLVSLLRDTGAQLLLRDTSDVASASIEHIMESADVIHFCIPAHHVPKIPSRRSAQLVILHDSVMQSSNRVKKVSGVAVHMLMNDQKRVVIDQNNPQAMRAWTHFRDLGQRPMTMSANDHDRMIARTQAPLVLLMKVLLDDLRTWHSQCLLTPSSVELLRSLERRSINWTESTINSILKNPELAELIKDLNHTQQMRSKV